MNISDYVTMHIDDMSHRKRKQMIRKVENKIKMIRPRILEAKLRGLSSGNKIFKYEKKLRSTLNYLHKYKG